VSLSDATSSGSSRRRVELRPSTRALYEAEARRYVPPSALARQPIGSLTPADVRAFVAGLGAGAATIEVVHRLVRRTLAQAVSDGLIPANPAARTRVPHARRSEPRILTAAEVEALASIIDPRYAPMVRLAAYVGLRFGE
jgi:integrase